MAVREGSRGKMSTKTQSSGGVSTKEPVVHEHNWLTSLS
jgi:hypothetical protein